VATKKKDVGIGEVAKAAGVDEALVLDILRERPDLDATREVQDKVFKTARRLGYDFKKLKIGKRMQHRKELLDEVLSKVAQNPGWGRGEIVKFLKECRSLMDRVHQRVFKDEFGGAAR
jgi:hypothetical protein